MCKQIFAAIVALLGLNAAAAAQTCILPSVADKVELKQVPGTNLVMVPVAINGTPKRFLLNVGTTPTTVSQATAAELGLPASARATTPVQFDTNPNMAGPQSHQAQLPVYDAKSGLGRDALRPRVRIGSFTIGDATGKNLTFMVAKEGEVGKLAPYDGLLTNDFFKQYDVEMDFGAMELTYLTPNKCTDPEKVAYWTHAAVAVVPMTLSEGKIRVPVIVQGHTIIATIDTSSPNTVMRRDIAELTLGFKADTPDMMPAGDARDGMGRTVYGHTFAKIAFVGGVAAANVPVLISANSLLPADDKELVLGSKARSADARIPDLVLGMDVLHQLHLYAVFGQGMLYVTQVFFT
jgi:hypothetical protein